jgi:hypothetical protein
MASKDWTGNSIANLKTMGASSHASYDREQHDYYATEPKAVRLFLEMEPMEGPIWECACGEGHLSEEMKAMGYEVYSTDLIDRNYGDGQLDFLSLANMNKTEMNIITNPPYKFANAFIIKAMSIMQEGKKLALFLPIRYLEGKARKDIFAKFPPKVIYISSSRLICAFNGKFEDISGSATAYSWFVWEKGYAGPTTLKWFN